jgi:hypothetical protein
MKWTLKSYREHRMEMIVDEVPPQAAHDIAQALYRWRTLLEMIERKEEIPAEYLAPLRESYAILEECAGGFAQIEKSGRQV